MLSHRVRKQDSSVCKSKKPQGNYVNTDDFNAQILLWYKLIKRTKNISSQYNPSQFSKKPPNKLAQDEVGHSHVLIKVGLSFAQVAKQQTASSALRTEGLIGPLS